jgi:hypothetical protein
MSCQDDQNHFCLSRPTPIPAICNLSFAPNTLDGKNENENAADAEAPKNDRRE